MQKPRRQFILGALSGLGASVAWRLAHATAPSCASPGIAMGRGSDASATGCAPTVPLLQPTDFTYLGKYRISAWPYMHGFTVRRYGNEVRFITRVGANQQFFQEHTTSGVAFEESCPLTQQWRPNGKLQFGPGRHESLFWDSALNRLWFVQAVDYPGGDTPAEGYPTNITLVDIPDRSGLVSSAARISLQGVPDRKILSGVARVPPTAQTAYALGPYVAGFGGYASMVTAAGGAVLNLSLYSLPNPTPYMANSPPNATFDPSASGTRIPSGHFQPIFAPGSVRGVRIWHGYHFAPDGGSITLKPLGNFPGGRVPTGSYYPKAGKSVYGPINWIEGAGGVDPHANGDLGQKPMNYDMVFRPGPPYFISPRPDAHPRWPAGSVAYFQWDKYVGAAWIHTGSKRGFVALASVGNGRSYYISSAGYCDRASAELHLFDPDDLGAIRSGRLSSGVESLRPYAMAHLAELDHGNGFVNNDTFFNHWMAYDEGPSADGKARLYVFMNRPQRTDGDDSCHVHVYAVSQ